MQSPLLSGEDADGTPSLSEGPTVAEESEFARLIARQSPLDGLPECINERQRMMGLSSNYALLQVEPNCAIHARCSNTLSVLPPRGPLTTAFAGTLSILHLLFVWTAYTSDAWADTRVRISIEWQQEYLSVLSELKETVIKSTNLVSLLRDLSENQSYAVLVLVWSVSLILPCTFMIVSPTFVLADSMHPIFYAHRIRNWNYRDFFETMMRWAFLTFYVLILLSLATSSIELRWTDTTIRVGNRARGSLAAYFMGIGCAVGLAILLRSPPKDGAKAAAQSGTEPPSETAHVRPPPPQAFQHLWMPTDQEDEPSMIVLEESSILPSEAGLTRPGFALNSGVPTPELVSENDGIEQEIKGLDFWQKFVTFQLGLLSVVLWIPSFYLPFLHISYGGLATDLLSEPVLRLYVWDIPIYLWSQGLEFGTQVWILMAAGFILLMTTLILPLVASCLGVLAWVGEGVYATKCYSWLFAFHPALSGMVYSIALLTMTHSLTPYTASLLDQKGSAICQKFNEMTGEACLDVTAKVLPGLWFYLFQSLTLELFVRVTLKWC